MVRKRNTIFCVAMLLVGTFCAYPMLSKESTEQKPSLIKETKSLARQITFGTAFLYFVFRFIEDEPEVFQKSKRTNFSKNACLKAAQGFFKTNSTKPVQNGMGPYSDLLDISSVTVIGMGACWWLTSTLKDTATTCIDYFNQK